MIRPGASFRDQVSGSIYKFSEPGTQKEHSSILWLQALSVIKPMSPLDGFLNFLFGFSFRA
jgi:hypothetical protein